MVITTREDPNLPLARLRVRGQLTELRAADLRFTPVEAAAFLNQVMDLNLTGEDISALERIEQANLFLAPLTTSFPTPTHHVNHYTNHHINHQMM